MQEEVAVDPMLTNFLAGRDVACPACGYNVRDLQTNRCPECGDQLQVSLQLVEPRQAAAIAGLIGLSAGLGLGGLLLIYLVIMSMIGQPIGGGEFYKFFGVNGIGFLVHAVALTAWLWKWRQIRLASLGVRLLLVVVCWLLPIAFVTVFAMSIR